MGVGCVCSLGGGVGGNGGAVGVVCVCVRAGVVSAAHHVFGITMADSSLSLSCIIPFGCVYMESMDIERTKTVMVGWGARGAGRGTTGGI